MKEFDVRVQSLIYQITTLSKLEAEKAEKKLLYDYLAAVMQELPEEPTARAHMLDAMERTAMHLWAVRIVSVPVREESQPCRNWQKSPHFRENPNSASETHTKPHCIG